MLLEVRRSQASLGSLARLTPKRERALFTKRADLRLVVTYVYEAYYSVRTNVRIELREPLLLGKSQRKGLRLISINKINLKKTKV